MKPKLVAIANVQGIQRIAQIQEWQAQGLFVQHRKSDKIIRAFKLA